MHIYHYWGYGLHIASEIAFPELLPITFDNAADVTIKLGTTPRVLTGENIVRRLQVSISPTQYLLKVNGVATYYAHNSSEIIVEPEPGADDQSIRLFLLSNVMAAIIHQRDMVPMHASAIVHQDGIVLFCGESGVGKSTTISKLNQIGYKLFSDDVCVLRNTTGNSKKIEAFGSYPMIKLWQNSFKILDLPLAESNAQIRPHLPKYAGYFHEEFITTAQPVKQIFILEKSVDSKKASIKKLNSIEAFSQLEKNIYRRLQAEAAKKRKVNFTMLTQLTSKIPVFRLSRPRNTNSLSQLVDLVDSHLKSTEFGIN